MRLRVGLIVAAVLAFGAQSVAAGTDGSNESNTATEQSTTAAPTTQPPTTQPTTTQPTTTQAPTTQQQTTQPTPATIDLTGDVGDDQTAQGNARRDEGPGAAAGRPGRRGGQIQVVPTPAPPPTIAPALVLPANSGAGRRIVYHKSRQRVWLVDANNNVVKTHLVSGRLTWNQPTAGQHFVFSRSIYTCAVGNSSVCWKYMVRFTYGPGGLAIGFHEIPTNFATGRKLQSISQLGTPLSAGCVRQAPWDAKFLWDWAPVGTQVIVIQ